MEPSRTLTLSSVGQITIPRSIRKLLNLEEGAKLELEVDKDTIILKRQKTHDEIFAELERFHKTLPSPEPGQRTKAVGEASMKQAREIEGDSWV